MVLLGEQPAPPSNVLSTALGVAAVVLIAGWALIQWQRDRLRFGLMRTALEKGVTRFPGTPPYWLISLRQGVTLVALGGALAIVGSTAWWLARGVEMPKSSQIDRRPPPPPPSDSPGHHGGARDDGPPGGGGRQPPPQDSERERWHDAQMQQTIGLVTVGAGFVLILLGIVRIAFAKVEKQFANESDENAMY